jgi:glyoxylase-like metal-dependent hydrolase (beta-lactamase superfamily II)
MRSHRAFGIAAAAALLASGAAVAADPEFPAGRMYATVRVADGVYAFIPPPTSSPVVSGNVVAVIGDDGVLVVDSGRFPALARRIISDIRSKTDRPVRYLVHTHWHLDHIVGDAEFRAAYPGITFLSTEFTRRKMLEKQPGYLANLAKTNGDFAQQLDDAVKGGKRSDGSPLTDADVRFLRMESADLRFEIAQLAGAKIVDPVLTFDRTLTVHLGRRDVRIAFLGKGNTAGDTVTFVPDSRVVITGDLLVAPVPYGYGCHPSDWIQTLKALMSTDAATIVPGHGPVFRDWDYARKVIAVLDAIRSQVAAAVRDGATLEETRKRVDLAIFRKEFAGEDPDRARAFKAFFADSAIDRAWQEAKGAMAEE